jgi:LysM repeat protein
MKQMMKFRFVKLTFASILGLAVFTASAFALSYVVKKGDILSRIAQKNIAGPIYGKGGSLQKLLELNPKIKNPNLIFVGDRIQIPYEQPSFADSTPASTPPASRAPAAESEKIETIETDTSFKAHHRPFEISISAGNSYFTSTDKVNNSKAGVASNINFGASAAYVQNISGLLHLKGKIALEHQSYNPIDTRTLINSDRIYLDYGLGLLMLHNIDLISELTVGMQARPLLRTNSSTSLIIDAVSIPYTRYQASGNFWETSNGMKFGSSLGAKLLFPVSAPASNRMKLGYGATAEVYSKELLKRGNELLLKLSFEYEKQDSKLSDRSYYQVGLGARYQFGASK